MKTATLFAEWDPRPEPAEKLRSFYTLLATPVGKEQRLRDVGVEIKLEGQSEGKSRGSQKGSRFEKFFSRGGGEDGLLIVDALSLPRRFSWGRYRTDILGFLSGAGIVLFFLLMLWFFAGVGA